MQDERLDKIILFFVVVMLTITRFIFGLCEKWLCDYGLRQAVRRERRELLGDVEAWLKVTRPACEPGARRMRS